MKELQRDKRPLVQLATSLVFTREKGKTKVLLVDRPSSKSRWPDQIMLGWGGKVDKDATPDETVRGMFARLSRETRRERREELSILNPRNYRQKYLISVPDWSVVEPERSQARYVGHLFAAEVKPEVARLIERSGDAIARAAKDDQLLNPRFKTIEEIEKMPREKFQPQYRSIIPILRHLVEMSRPGRAGGVKTRAMR